VWHKTAGEKYKPSSLLINTVCSIAAGVLFLLLFQDGVDALATVGGIFFGCEFYRELVYNKRKKS
jgi:hypothetical protein